jgi:hypothetical protein
VFGLLVYATGLPVIQVWLSDRPVQWVVTVALGVGCLIVRGLSARAAHLNIVTNDHRGLILLDLGMVPPVHGRVRRASAPVARTTVAGETPHA